MGDELSAVVADGVLTVTFTRPHRHNAMTWAMYASLREAARRAGDDDVRVVVLRGAGGRAFVAGTDIAQFAAFGGGEGGAGGEEGDGGEGDAGADGVRYERAVAAVLDDLLAVGVPVVAVVEGLCVGAGLALAACADLVVATADARFGVPVARTLGNTLSAHTLALCNERLGAARVTDLLLTARLADAGEMHAAGFVARVLAADADVDAAVGELVAALRAHAPRTLWATVELQRRLREAGRGAAAREVQDADVLAAVYGSEDFREGVTSFVERRPARWTGR